MDRSWKRAERRIAARLDGRRIPVTGERDGADVVTATLCVQVKHGRRRPAFLRAWLDGIVGTAIRAERIGVIVWQARGERTDEAIVLVRLRDFEALCDRRPMVAGDEVTQECVYCGTSDGIETAISDPARTGTARRAPRDCGTDRRARCSTGSDGGRTLARRSGNTD
jgi:hypothetical protein